MRQILQSLKTGELEVADIPVPMVKAGHLLIRSSRSLISVGTERMLLDFGYPTLRSMKRWIRTKLTGYGK